MFNRQEIIQHYKIANRIRMGIRGRVSYDLLKLLDLLELNIGIDVHGLADVLAFNLLKNASKERFNLLYPCQLSLSLLKLLGVSSNNGHIILDPFVSTFTISAVSEEL